MEEKTTNSPTSFVVHCQCKPEEGDDDCYVPLEKAREQARLKFERLFQDDTQRLVDHFNLFISTIKHLEKCPTCPKKN